MSDFLKLEIATAAWFWLPYAVPSGMHLADRWAIVGLTWFVAWIASPFVTMVGALMIPRAWRQPAGWLQILLGLGLAGSVWYGCSRIRFC